MDRLELSERAAGKHAVAQAPAYSLDEWRAAGRPAQAIVRCVADADLAGDYTALAAVSGVVIEFPVFMDGRGFSHARKLRQLGFTGALLADGDLLADQWAYLERCGFSGLASAELEAHSARLTRVRNGYQADSLEPRPLFRRRFG